MTNQSEPGDGRLDPGLSTIMSERRQLINLAYRFLSSLADAEDPVQETYARWYAIGAGRLDRPDCLYAGGVSAYLRTSAM
ncbi:MAG TPA: sigma factor [Micromonospora sp.]|nr:sigma factor [Micromonospora sp.]